MHRPTSLFFIAAALALLAGGCAGGGSDSDWITLANGAEGLDSFNQVGQATWTASDDGLQATLTGSEPAYLVSKNTYTDFVLRVEFWVSDDANSGVFLRCQDPEQISDTTCYESNIFDQRPDPTYGTGAIVNVARTPDPMPKAGGRWNTYEITAEGSHLVLVLNGVTTVDVEDATHSSGPIALQWGGGTVKFRKVEIKPL